MHLLLLLLLAVVEEDEEIIVSFMEPISPIFWCLDR
jgi:hypothetical protein